MLEPDCGTSKPWYKSSIKFWKLVYADSILTIIPWIPGILNIFALSGLPSSLKRPYTGSGLFSGFPS